MKRYLIKYEGLSGEVHCKTISAHSERHAISQLFYVKEIYWIKPVTRQPPPQKRTIHR
jgi:hypothetical protein